MAEGQVVGLEEILRQHGLTREDCDKKCPTDNIMLQIANKIVDWKMMGYSFGIPNQKLVAIDVENRTEETRRIALFHTWKEREGSRATYLRLMKVLHQLGRNDLAEELCKQITSASRSRSGNGISGTGTPTLPVAFKELLPVAASWKNIGTLLAIATHVLDTIQANEGRVEDCLREMLSKWLKQVTPQPTWAALADAVEPFNETIAHNIRELDNS